MAGDPYTHMEEAYGLDFNPFPGEAISSDTDAEHYSEDVFPKETAEFRMKMIRGGLQGGRKTGFLWSKSPYGEDTGYGKTALMRATVRAINHDLGDDVQTGMRIKPERIKSIAGAFTGLNEGNLNGLYPILFAATLDLATGEHAPLVRARERLLTETDDDLDAVWDLVTDRTLALAPTGAALRPDLMAAFVESPAALNEMLAGVSDASRLRNGIQYFTGALYILAAAGIEKLFLMVDQLEDLGKKGALSAAKRRREIGRIRDLLETEPFASRLHMSFTFHQAAAQNLEADWHANRLPNFDPVASNSAALVILRGLQRDEQVEELMKVWMAPARNENAGPSPTSPFNEDARDVLRAASQGRAGILLNRANELLMAGAEAQVGEIDGAFAQQHFKGQGQLAGVAVGGDDDPGDDVYEDLLG